MKKILPSFFLVKKDYLSFMSSRRDFLKKASLFAGATALTHVIPESIQKALAIEAAPGSTYLDAEHIVFLMQENRSFDHCFGMLKGVRGFNDPRTYRGPDRVPVWHQTMDGEKSYGPFHLDIENTQVTWMGDLPHGWRDMVMARNNGKMDKWLLAKRPGNQKYRHIPLTMGYYERKDIPFYYAFADAFTVCDQHFCSSLTGTSANRSYFWTGTVRETPRDPNSVAHVDNGQINYRDLTWKTYPERLQEAGISWKVYQNELSLPVGLTGEEEDWLANFTDNNLEFHKQYQVKFHPAYQAYAKRRIREIEHELTVARYASQEAYQKVVDRLNNFKKDVEQFSALNFAKLSKIEQEIHERAFTTNTNDPDYHKLEKISYTADGKTVDVQVPKGDIFHQFRKDVQENKLPAVSWLTAPCRFSDHPSSPWYGAWYVSETLDILTSNPEVWKKTIFVLTYDENDGYFDHAMPFVPPLSNKPDTGRVAKGVDTQDEYVTVEQERIRTNNPEASLESPIGLGYRVPMVIASPWSKGGWVNSEVFDHSSSLQFMEHFFAKKIGKKVLETNISAWRRLVCGDLTSAFRPIPELKKPEIDFVDRNAYVGRIHAAKDRQLPGNFVAQDYKSILDEFQLDGVKHYGLGIQEKGTKLANAIPYDLDVNLQVDLNKQRLTMIFELAGKLKANKKIGAPLIVTNHTVYKEQGNSFQAWNFAVKAGEQMSYSWDMQDFLDGRVSFTLYGPNGYFREFKLELDKLIPRIIGYQGKGQVWHLKVDGVKEDFLIKDLGYGLKDTLHKAGRTKVFSFDLQDSHGWYDFLVRPVSNEQITYRFAGHVDHGKSSRTDPLMGG